MAPLAPEVPASGPVEEVPAAPEPAVSQALVTASSPPTAASPLPGSSAPAAVLERALLEMTQLQADLLSEDPRLAPEVGLWLASLRPCGPRDAEPGRIIFREGEAECRQRCSRL